MKARLCQTKLGEALDKLLLQTAEGHLVQFSVFHPCLRSEDDLKPKLKNKQCVRTRKS